MFRIVQKIGLICIGSGLLAACVPATGRTSAPGASGPTSTPIDPVIANPRQPDLQHQIPDYQPVFRFDAIPPIYHPEFVPAGEAPLTDDELVLGFALEGEARAYPISVLRFREIVNDEISGTPILVTW